MTRRSNKKKQASSSSSSKKKKKLFNSRTNALFVVALSSAFFFERQNSVCAIRTEGVEEFKSAGRNAARDDVPPRPPLSMKNEEEEMTTPMRTKTTMRTTTTTTALGKKGIKKVRLEPRDVESYSSSDSWLEKATEMEKSDFSPSEERGRKRERADANLASSEASTSSSSSDSRKSSSPQSHRDWDSLAERYARAHDLYVQKKMNAAKVAEEKHQKELEREEEETKRKFFVGRPKLVDGRYQHVSKSRSKGSFALEHVKGHKSHAAVAAPATREKENERGLHHRDHHGQRNLHPSSFIESSSKGAHEGNHGFSDKDGSDVVPILADPPGDLSVDIPRLGSEGTCHSYDKPCNVDAGSGNAIVKLSSSNSNKHEDRIWTFTFESVPFSTEPGHETGWQNSFDQPLHWASNDHFMTGWYSEHSNRHEDRRFKIKYRALAHAYTISDCSWSSENAWDGGYTWYQPSSEHYVFGVKSYHNNKREDRKNSFRWCKVNPPPPPPPPSPPPPNPPPPAPPPPGEIINKPIISVDNPLEIISDREYDFRITVSDDGCAGEPHLEAASDGSKKLCLATEASVAENTARGLHCKAYVGNDSCTYEKATDTFPCMKWDNFFNPKKSRSFRKSLTFRDGNQEVAYSKTYGKYSIYGKCGWFYDAPHYTKAVPGTSTEDFEKLYEFEVEEGCNEWMEDPATDSKLIARLFLLSAPDFIDSKKCEYLDETKEMLFRKFDVAPMDGVLSAEEILTAFRTHDVDTSYAKRLIENHYFADLAKMGLLLHDVKNSPATPLACVDTQADGTQMYFVNVTYPRRSTTEKQCLDEKFKVDLAWDYVKKPADSDKQCIFADGKFFEKTVGKDNPSVTDYRPPSFVGPDRVELVAQLTFDAINTKIPTGFSKTVGEPGGFVLEQTSARGDLYAIEVDVPMEDSAIMMWVSIQKMQEDKFLWYASAVSGDNIYEKYIKITSNRKVKAGFFKDRYLVESKAPLEVATWTHVAISVNKPLGFSIFINGNMDDNVGVIDNTKIDFPTITPIHALFDTSLNSKFDDYRMYTGFVTSHHVHAVYKCGRMMECASRAYSTPQSRRIYCVFPHYRDLGSDTPPTPVCTTGLFYYGSALDLEEFADHKGVMFQFRDTAVGEVGYEVLRRRADGARTLDGSQAVATTEYKSVVLIEASLGGCAAIFSSLTFFDDVAIREPGVMWEFAIQTKYQEAKLAPIISDPSYYIVPWVGVVQGTVTSARNAIPVGHVRVCARTNATVELALALDQELASDKARFMPVAHSNRANKDKRSKAYRVTDDDFTTGVSIGFDEYVNITLAGFTFVTSVDVCTQIPKTESALGGDLRSKVHVSNHHPTIDREDLGSHEIFRPEFDVRVLDYPDPNDRGDKGSQCSAVVAGEMAKPNILKDTSAESEVYCQTYTCAGTNVTSFMGQYITVRSLNENGDEPILADVQAIGTSGNCPYYAFSDDRGNFEMDIIEPKGNLNKKQEIGVKAYREDIFDTVEMFFLNATDKSEPEMVIIALDVDVDKFAALSKEITKGYTAPPPPANTFVHWSEKPEEGSKADVEEASEEAQEEMQTGAKKEEEISELGIKRGASSVLFFSYCQGNSSWYNYPRVDLGPEKFAELYTWEHNVLYRKCPECDTSHQYIYYKRLTEIAGQDMYSLLFYSWTSENNVMGKDFNLYSTLMDAHLGENAWKICNYDDTNSSIAFPYNCAPGYDFVADNWYRTSNDTESTIAPAYRVSPKVEALQWYIMPSDVPPTPAPPPPYAPSPPPPPPPSDKNNDNFVDYAEIVDYARNRTRYIGTRFIIPQSFWDVADGDGDYKLNPLEWEIVEAGIKKGIVFGTPWFVFPSIKTKHLTGFRTVYSNKNHKSAAIALVPAETASVPFMEEEWQVWYQNATLTYPEMSVTTVAKKTLSDSDSGLLSMGFPTSVIQEAKYVLPFATLTDGTHISFKDVVHLEDLIALNEEEKGLVHRMFGASSIELRADKRLEDIVHVFNEKGNEDITEIVHLSSADMKIQDKTTVPVSGVVRFPPNRTQGFICGLQFPTILAYEGQLCDFDELHECSPRGYKYETKPDSYDADELGFFDLALSPGTTWAFVATYDGHDICFGGDSIEAEACDKKNITDIKFYPTTNTAYNVQRTEISMGEDNYTTNAFFELVEVGGGEFLSFFDVTSRSVDIGLYAGACSTEYKDYSLMITPANGCGTTQAFSDQDLHLWPMVNPSDEESTYRSWPFAAMDYYIELYQTPDVSGLTESVLLQANVGAECTPPGTDIMQFFRDRNTLVQTLKLLDRTEADAVYRYHGWLCANPTFGRSELSSLDAPFTNVRAEEVCLGEDITAGDLTLRHLIGVTNSEYSTLLPSDVTQDKYVSVQIVEAHWANPLSDDDPIFYCPKFTSTVNDVPTTLALSVQIQQDIEPMASNKCHPNNEPSPDCVMNAVNEVGLVMFPTDGDDSKQTHAFKISSKSAVPNLVSPYRRQFIASIQRYDGWAYTSLLVSRELVTLASKIRGGGDDPNARYQSDTKFYCTAPIRGLVFTVVHDPPGGNSFAAVAQGTRIEMSMEMHTTRGARRSSFSDEDSEQDVQYDFEIGPDMGTGYLNVASKIGGTGFPTIHMRQKTTTHTDYIGPEVSASATTDRGWDFHMVLDRNLQSSADPGTPGRPGDTLLGGGFEIVYIRIDTVDIRQQEEESSSSLGTEGVATDPEMVQESAEDALNPENTVDEEGERGPPKCLEVIPEIQWLPRKPTSYVMGIYTIEYRILPELQGLIAECDNKNSIATDAEMGDKTNEEIKAVWKARLSQTVDDWKRTIEWSSPDFNPEGLNALSKDEKKAKLDEIASRWDAASAALNSIDALMGKAMQPRIDDAYGMYTQNSELSDYTAEVDWQDLSFVWDSIKDENLPVKGIPPIRRQDEFNPYDGWTANRKAAGLDNSAAQNVLGLIAAITGIDIAQILLMQDSIENPNPHGYMDTEALVNIVMGADVPSEEYKGNDYMKAKYAEFQERVGDVQKKVDQMKSLAKSAQTMKEILPQLTKSGMSSDETSDLFNSDAVQSVVSLLPSPSAGLGTAGIDDAELGLKGFVDSAMNYVEEYGDKYLTDLLEQLLKSDKVQEFLPEGMDLEVAKQLFNSETISIIMPMIMDPKSIKPSDAQKLFESEPVQAFFKSDYFKSKLPSGVNVEAILDFTKSEAFKTIVPLIKDPNSLDQEDAKIIFNSEPVQNVLHSEHVTSMLPKGVTIEKVNAFMNSDLVPIISSIAKNPKDFDQDDAKAIIESEPVQNLLASKEIQDLIPEGIPIKTIQEILKSDIFDVILPIVLGESDFKLKDAQKIINSDLVQKHLLKSDQLKAMLPEGVDFSQVREVLSSELTKIIVPLLKDPKSFSQEDAEMIISSEPVKKLMTSDKVKEMLPEGIDLVQIQEFLTSDAFKVVTALAKGGKFTSDDAEVLLKSDPVQKLLRSDAVTELLPKNVNMSAIAEVVNSDMAKVLIPLFKDPKSFDSEDAKMLMHSKPMQTLFNSDQMKSILPAGLTFAEVEDFFNSENFEFIKSLVKDPSSFSAEDAKKIVSSKLFQKILSSDNFDSMLPNGITLDKVKTFVTDKNSKLIIALAKDGKLDKEDAHMFIKSEQVQNFLHSDKFNDMLPGDLTYEDVKAVLNGDVADVLTILSKGNKITADDAKTLLNSKPVQGFLRSDEFNERLPGHLTYDKVVKVLNDDAMKVLLSVAKGDSLTADDAKSIVNSDVFLEYMKSDQVVSMLPPGMSMGAVSEFIDSEEMKVIKLLAKGKNFSVQDARTLISSKPVQDYLGSKQFKKMLPANVTVDDMKVFMDEETKDKIIEIANKPASTLTSKEAQMIKELETIDKFLESHPYLQSLLKSPQHLSKDDVLEILSSKEVQQIVLEKAMKYFPEGYDAEKLNAFKDSFLVRNLLPMAKNPETATKANMMAVFESDEFKSAVLSIAEKMLPDDFSKDEISAFLESSDLKMILPLMKDPKSISAADAVEIITSTGLRDIVLEQCIKLLPKGVSVDDVNEFVSSGIPELGTPEFVLSFVKDPSSFTVEDAKTILSSKPVKDAIYEEMEKVLPKGMAIDDVKSFAESESVKTLLPLLQDPNKVTKDDLKSFLSTPEMEKIIFNQVSVVLPESAKVEDFQKFMSSSAGKKIIQLVKGDIDAEDFNGSDMMDLVSYEFKYCETEDEECKPFSIKSFVIEQAQDYIPHGIDTKKAEEIFSSPQVQALLPLLKNPKDFSADDVTNLLNNKDIKKALMDKVQENLPDGMDLSQAEEILSSKEVQEFLPLLSNPKDIRLDDFIKLLENDKIKTMLFSQVEDYLPSGWSIEKIEEMLKSETAQALLPLLKDPSDFGVDDLKTVMKDENIHKIILDQVKKILPADIDLSQAEKIITSDTVQSILPLLKNPEDFSVDDLKEILSSDEVKGMIYKKVQPLLPEGWDLKEAEELLKSDEVKIFMSLMKNPDDFTAEDAKVLLMNKDIQAGLLEQVTKLFDQNFGEDTNKQSSTKSSSIGHYEKTPKRHLHDKPVSLGEDEAASIMDFFKSDTIQTLLPLLEDPSEFSADDATKIFNNKEVRKVMFSQIEDKLPEGVTIEMVEALYSSGTIIQKLMTDPFSLSTDEMVQILDMAGMMDTSGTEGGGEVQQALDAINAGKKVTETHKKSGGDTDFSVAEAFGVGADAGEYERTCQEKCDKEKGCDSTSTGDECVKCYKTCKGMANTIIMINKFMDNYETKVKPMMEKMGIDMDSIFSQEDMTPEKEKARPHPERWEPRPEYGLSSYDVSGFGLEGANVFDSTEDSHSYGIFSRGMNRVSESGMFNHSGMDINDGFVKHGYAERFIDASMFGSQAGFSFGGGNDIDPKKDPMPSGKSQDIYLTFSGGGHVLEFTSSIEDRIDGMGYGWNFKADAEAKTDVYMEYEIMIKEGAMEQTTLYGKNDGIEHVMAWAKYGELSTTYSLGDSDPFDKFVVKVATDKRFGTPMFKTIGGASKCPAEPNTMWRESGLILTTQASAGMNNKFVSPQSSALFDVIITNESPYREAVNYGLMVMRGEQYVGDFGGNMLDLKFRINGEYVRPYGEMLPLRNIESVDNEGNLKYTRLALEIEKGRFGDEYTSIGLKLVSECESEMAGNTALYRDPLASNDAFLGDFKWERECPKVDWDVTTYNRFLHYTASKNTGSYVNMTLLNPDPLNLWSKDYKEGDTKKTNHLVHPHLEFVRIQWRTLGKGEWINAWTMVGKDKDIWKNDVEDEDAHCESARGQGCSFKWNIERQYFLNGLKDGEYEIRAKAFCSGYDSFAPMEVKGSETAENLNLVVDVVAPFALETSTLDHTFRIEYSEPIVCPQLSVERMTYEITQVETCAGDKVTSGDVAVKDIIYKHAFVCLTEKDSLAIEFPPEASGLYEVTVNADENGPKIMDIGGNTVRKQTFSTTIGCSNTGNHVVVKSSSARSDMGKASAGTEKRHKLAASTLKEHKKTLAPGLGEAEMKVPAHSPWLLSTPTILLVAVIIATLSLYTVKLTRKLREVEAKVVGDEGDSMLRGAESESEKIHPRSYGAIL